MPPKIEKTPEVPNIIAPAEQPKAREGQDEKGPKRSTTGTYLPAEYKTKRGNIRQDR